MYGLRRQSIRSTIRAITLVAAITSLLLTMVTPFVGTADAANISIGDDLDQWANGAPGDDPSTDGFWRNGNLNPQNSQYAEGESVAFRRELTGFEVGETYTVSISYDTINNGLVAYDYLTSWDRTEVEAEPLDGKTGYAGLPDRQAIETDPRLANTPGFTGSPSGPAEMAAWGADVLFVGNYRYSDGAATDPFAESGTTATTLDVVFTATQEQVLLAWGGHIAVQAHWDDTSGYDTAPRNTSGSPYHMRNTGTVDRLADGFVASDPATWTAVDSGNSGNQDRSIKAGAILVPGLNLTKSVDLEISEDAQGNPTATATVGDSFNYIITVSNSGEAGSALENVSVSDVVPAVFDITGTVATTQGTCNTADQTVTCALGTIPAAGVVTITIPVTVDVDPTNAEQGCGTYENTANATATGFDASASFSVTVTGCEPDLDIVKSTDLADPDPQDDTVDPVVAFGDEFNYLLTVTNHADATAVAINVVVTDTVPDAFTISGTPSFPPDGTCTVSGQDVTCDLGDLAPGGQVEITIPVTVDTIADGCATFPNTATVDADNSDAVTSDTVDVEVDGCAPSVTLDKTVSDDEVDVDGGTTTYTLTATNAANATATAFAVTVTDDVPDIFDIISASYTSPDGNGVCDVDRQTVECGPVDLAPGESLTVEIDVIADPTNVTLGNQTDLCGTVTNDGQALVDGELADEDTADVDIVDCGPDVSLAKTAQDAEVDVDGGSTSYVLTATNASGATAVAETVTVTDEVPAIFDIDSASYTLSAGGGGDCDLDGNLVECGPVDLAPGESITVTIQVTVDTDGVPLDDDGDWCDTVTNDGEVRLDGTEVDGDAEDVDVVDCAPELDIEKSTDLEEPDDGNPVVQLGDTFSYFLDVGSPSDATAEAQDVVVTDEVPGAFAIVGTPSFTGDAEGDCEVDDQVVTCDLGDLEPGDDVRITIDVRVRVVADSCDTHPNHATVDAANLDEIESNHVNVDVEGCEPDLQLEKTANVTHVDVDGGTATYTLTASNDDEATGTATDVTVTDTVPAIFDVEDATYRVDDGAETDCDVTNNDVSCGPEDLAPGSEMVVTIAITADASNVDRADGPCGPATNEGLLWDDQRVVDEDDVTLEVDGCDPDVSLEKSIADGTTSVSKNGGRATFVLTVDNDGDATATAEDVTITDEVNSAFRIIDVSPAEDCDVDGRTVTCGPVDLEAGDSFTARITVEAVGGANSCGTFPNAFDATWTDGYDEDEHDETSNTVRLGVTGCVPDIDLVKDVDVTEAAIGDLVTYTYTITNTGDLTLHDVQLVDEVEVNGILRDILELLGFDTTITLSPGESMTLTSVHLVTEDDLPGPIDNVATVTGRTSGGQEVSDTDDETVDPFGAPAIELDKLVAIPGADPAAPIIGVDPDDPAATTIPYEFTVTNTGNVTLTDVTLTDVVLSVIPEGGTPTFDEALDSDNVTYDVELDDTTLAPGESTTGTLTYTVRGVDVDNSVVVNVAEAVGTAPDDTEVSDEDDAFVSLQFPEVVLPIGIEVVKTPDVESVDYVVGSDEDVVITYTYDVTNTGEEPLTDLSLVDDVLGGIDLPVDVLEPGETVTVTAQHLVTEADAEAGEVVNVVVVQGTAPDGRTAEDDDDARVVVEEIEVLPQVITRPLPRTGVNTTTMALFAALIAGLGAMLLVAIDATTPATARRRRRQG